MTERWKPSVTVAAIVWRLREPPPGLDHGDATRNATHDTTRSESAELEFLLVEEHTPEGLMLNNPAGHLDPEESLLQGVVREVLEETACVFTPDRLIGVYLSRFVRPSHGDDVTYLRFAFGGTVGAADPSRALDHGIVRTLWLTLPELRASRARHRSAQVLACIEDHLAGRRYPLEAIHTSASVYEPEVKG